MKYFYDSSALVKRYLPEIGTAWVRATIRQSLPTDVYIAYVTGPEVMAAFARKLRSDEISAVDYNTATNTFVRHFRHQYVRLHLSLTVVHKAMDLTKKHRLRGYDAVQLATALILRDFFQKHRVTDLTFVSADNKLCQAATAEGLLIENPNNYP
jgi:predicted nucleic acid-binding protein